MSEIKVNKISPRTACGTTTLGDSGDTFTIPAGVTITNNGTQTGFGREGSVDWQTSIKTGDFTAVSGEGYFINTTSGPVTMTLPSSPSAGAIVALKDYANTFDTNNLTIGRNGQPLSGDTSDAVVSTEGQSLTLVYGDATKGWQAVAAATESDLPKPAFITATGGTITTVCTNYKVHTFTGPGTFTVCSVGNSAGSNEVSYLVVAGGGSGGMTAAGGGGAGGYREGRTPQCNTWTASPIACISGSNNGLPVSATSYPIVVGGGGAGTTTNPSPGNPGNVSSFSTISSAGGGSGAGGSGPGSGTQAGSGGSGGGAQAGTSPSNPDGGAGNTPPVSPAQGFKGGDCPSPSGAPSYAGAGGGGATAAGENGSTGSPHGDGGAGATSSINGTPTARAGGGGGSTDGNNPGDSLGGAGGGGQGGIASIRCAGAGTANTGGGSGALAHNNSSAAAGGSGIVIIRYRFQ
jgi:hypothetical protein